MFRGCNVREAGCQPRLDWTYGKVFYLFHICSRFQVCWWLVSHHPHSFWNGQKGDLVWVLDCWRSRPGFQNFMQTCHLWCCCKFSFARLSILHLNVQIMVWCYSSVGLRWTCLTCDTLQQSLLVFSHFLWNTLSYRTIWSFDKLSLEISFFVKTSTAWGVSPMGLGTFASTLTSWLLED